MMRNVYAVLVGMMLAFFLVAVGDSLAGMMFQLPKGLDPNDPATKAAFEAAMMNAPLRAILAMVGGYFVAALGGAFVARKLVHTPTMIPSLTVGVLLLVATIANFAMMKHPMLMMVLGAMVPVPGAWLGGYLASTKMRD